MRDYMKGFINKVKAFYTRNKRTITIIAGVFAIAYAVFVIGATAYYLGADDGYRSGWRSGYSAAIEDARLDNAEQDYVIVFGNEAHSYKAKD